MKRPYAASAQGSSDSAPRRACADGCAVSSSRDGHRAGGRAEGRNRPLRRPRRVHVAVGGARRRGRHARAGRLLRRGAGDGRAARRSAREVRRDAAMAVFGAPRVRDDDAERAVRAGLALVAAVQRVGAGLGLAPGVLRLRVGVAERRDRLRGSERRARAGHRRRGQRRGSSAGGWGARDRDYRRGHRARGRGRDRAGAPAVVRAEREGRACSGLARAVGVHADGRGSARSAGCGRRPSGATARSRAFVRSSARPRRVTVVAPPGVGKTRLLDELAAAAAGAAVLRARLRPDVLSPFEPVAQLAARDAAATELVALARAAGATGARAAVVAELLGAVGPAEVHPAAEREQLFAAWLEGLDAIAGERAAVWLVEDVHWASPDLLAFLELAGGSARSAGRLVVASTRPVLLDERPEWVEAASGSTCRCSRRARRRSSCASSSARRFPQTLVARVAERSAGNPLFVEELLRTWAAVGILAAEEAGWRLAAPAEEVELPLTVQAIYAAQLDDLPPPARAAARRAAVAGAASRARRSRCSRWRSRTLRSTRSSAGRSSPRRRGRAARPEPLLQTRAPPRRRLREPRARRAGTPARAARGLARGEARAVAIGARRGRRPALRSRARGCSRAGARDRRLRARRASGASGRVVRDGGARRPGFAAWASARDLAARALELSEEEGLGRARRLHLLGEATASAVGVDEALPLLDESLEVYRAWADAAREGIVDAACSLGRLLRAQTQFAAHGGARRPAPARARRARGRGHGEAALAPRDPVLSAWDDFDRARGDAERALDSRAARRRPGRRAQGAAAPDQPRRRATSPSAAVGRDQSLARARGRWELAVGACKHRPPSLDRRA